MIDWTKPLHTKTGKPAFLILGMKPSIKPYTRAVFVEGEQLNYHEDGKWIDDRDYPLNLENIPETEILFVNLYTSCGRVSAYPHKTEATARAAAPNQKAEDYIGLIKIYRREGVSTKIELLS